MFNPETPEREERGLKDFDFGWRSFLSPILNLVLPCTSVVGKEMEIENFDQRNEE